MDLGRMNRRITIQHKAVTGRASNGEELRSWATYRTAWAALEPINGREFLTERDTLAQQVVRFRMRYQPGIDPAMRILHDGSVFEIVEVLDPNHRHLELELTCNVEAQPT